MLDKEYNYFVSVRDNLVKEHPGEYVVIVGYEILDFYGSEKIALEAMVHRELGTFLIQHCIPEKESIQKYHSRVIFA